MVRHELSVLIPTFNDECFQLVSCLKEQLQQHDACWEIIVADDGSTCLDVIKINRNIRNFQHCYYLERQQNTGRAAIRNFLAQQAKYEWLLFLDSDMKISSTFIQNYLYCQDADVIDGGIKIKAVSLRDNLRYLHEKRIEKSHTLEYRRKNPYQDFHTANFLIRKKVLLECPFDERFVSYGYEDVLLGKVLQEKKKAIIHIENPALFDIFESNASFVSKTEEGLRTLHRFKDELKTHSHMLTKIEILRHTLPLPLIRMWHRLLGRLERRLLIGKYPNLRIFDLYRLGYYLCIKED